MPKGVFAGACAEEFKNNNDFGLLHHKFFCKGGWRWWCGVIAFLMSFMTPVVFVSFYLFVLSCGPLVVLL
jgi:hypothetical protein